MYLPPIYFLLTISNENLSFLHLFRYEVIPRKDVFVGLQKQTFHFQDHCSNCWCCSFFLNSNRYCFCCSLLIMMLFSWRPNENPHWEVWWEGGGYVVAAGLFVVRLRLCCIWGVEIFPIYLVPCCCCVFFRFGP